jgi:UDP-N-acetylmuramyl pentapeptide phosphotransferase/UDP-N-acetylglucosamine-1-phosphate transferase
MDLPQGGRTVSGVLLIKLFAFFAGVVAASWLTTRWVTRALARRSILDEPNRRSSHSAPTPRGGGIALLAVALPLLALIFYMHHPADVMAWVVLGGAVMLAAISWADDLRGLSVLLRLGVHGAAVAAALAVMPANLFVFQGAVPLLLDRFMAAVLWIWFINLFNFMDGIDGIAGIETISIGGGLATTLVVADALAAAAPAAAALTALTLAAVALGFLVLNWHPAKVFLGDVGSIPLGYLLGWLLLTLAAWGYWVAALILPAYYLADATITIGRRALTGQRVWEAHAGHFYQRAVQRGFTHGRVARLVLGGNLFLVVVALASSQVLTPVGDALCLMGAAAIVAVMLAWMARATPVGAS